MNHSNAKALSTQPSPLSSTPTSPCSDRRWSIPDAASLPAFGPAASADNDANPPEYDFTTAVAVLTFHKGNTLRIAGIDQSVADALREICSERWPQGLQESHWSSVPSLVPLYYKVKFKGVPWESGPAQAVMVRQLICAILRVLLQHGWHLEATSDLSKSPLDKDTLVFLRAAPQVVAPGGMFALSLNSTDRLRVIDATERVISAVRHTIARYWPAGIHEEKQVLGSFEFRLRGDPWFGHLDNSITSRYMLAKLLAHLKNMGYTLYSSVDISRGCEGQDLDSWIFVRDLPQIV